VARCYASAGKRAEDGGWPLTILPSDNYLESNGPPQPHKFLANDLAQFLGLDYFSEAR
jgi:hypothetical protein